ncbi:SGNH/GDSL hydrolase family protein [Rhodococcus hoagii]|nr:SGNH/GDSL hydrolase family protein [Prescottella equi]
MFSRFVAIGDSQSEGLNDGDDARGYRGWADRLAERLAEIDPGVQYANLAIRGRLARQVREEQLARRWRCIPTWRPSSRVVNDLLRPKFEPVAIAAELEIAFEALSASGARVLTMAFPTLGAGMPGGRAIMARISALNTEIRKAAARHDVAVIDWSCTRVDGPAAVELGPAAPQRDGHDRLAAAAATVLGLHGTDLTGRTVWDPFLRSPCRRACARMPTGLCVSSGRGSAADCGNVVGAGRVAKRPELAPVRP